MNTLTINILCRDLSNHISDMTALILEWLRLEGTPRIIEFLGSYSYAVWKYKRENISQ